MLTAVIFFVILLASYLWVSRPKRPPNFPPGPPTFLIFGNFIDLLKASSKDFQKHTNRLRAEYGSDIIGLLDLFGRPIIHVFGGDLIKETCNQSELNGRPSPFPSLYSSDMKKAGIFFNDGQLWHEQRHFVLKHLRNLGMGKNLLNTMIAEEYISFTGHLKKMTRKEVKANDLFGTTVLNVIWKMVADERFDYDDPEREQLRTLITEFTKIVAPQKILSWLPSSRFIAPEASGFNKLKRFKVEMTHMFKRRFTEHKATLDANNPRDLIDAFLIEMQRPDAAERGFDRCNLQTNVFDLFIAGTDTTSTSLTWAMLLMVLHPDIQTKMQAELDEVIGEGRLPSYEDRPRLPYTEAVMTEIWRFGGFIPLGVPHFAANGPAQLAGYTIPQGSTVLLHLYSAHNDRAHWGDPEAFRPERFIGDDGKFRKDDFFMQFGLGKRACLGEAMAKTEFFTFMACLFYQFRLRLPKGAAKPSTEVREDAIFLQPDDFNVILEQRREE